MQNLSWSAQRQLVKSVFTFASSKMSGNHWDSERCSGDKENHSKGRNQVHYFEFLWTCDTSIHIFKMSFNISWRPTGLDSPVEGKVKHRSQCSIYRHCCRSVSESEPARYMKVNMVHMSNPLYPWKLWAVTLILHLWHSSV